MKKTAVLFTAAIILTVGPMSALASDTDTQTVSDETSVLDESAEGGIVYSETDDSAAAEDTTETTSDTTTTKKTVKQSIKLNKTSLTIDKGSKKTLKATVKGADSSDIVWKSSNKKVATVTQKGVVKAKSKGKTTITAKIKGTNISVKCKVTVRNYKVYTMRLSAYCSCSKCTGSKSVCRTASGTKPKQGRTVAVDTSIIPLGSKVVIGGKTYRAEDTGGSIKGNEVDVYFKNHKKALLFGVKYKKVKVYY